jgi:ABC-2 type transport system ATP-binding protein
MANTPLVATASINAGPLARYTSSTPGQTSGSWAEQSEDPKRHANGTKNRLLITSPCFVIALSSSSLNCINGRLRTNPRVEWCVASVEQPAIETRRLRKDFGSATAVDDLDLRVEAGSFFGFLGPNGAGKSTTIRILTGTLLPTSGTATILGHDIAENPVDAKRIVGVVSEEGAVFERLTGAEYLEFVGRMYAMDRETIGARSRELLELMDLTADESKLIVDYSHGMRKKLGFAAALIHDPRVLFLDEPFEGIDAVTSRLIKAVLNQLRRSGVTIFLTSHILEIVERLCTEIAIIDHGRVVASGSLGDLRARTDAGSSLEDLFLELVGKTTEDERPLSWLE